MQEDRKIEPLRALDRLDRLIREALPAFTRDGGNAPSYQAPRIPITESEASGFFRALDSGFFELETDGLCIPRTMRPSTGFSYPLLSRVTKDSDVIVLWREWLTHASLPPLLHHDLGYPRHDIALDVDGF
jgi:hypothetical protein